MFVHEWKYNGFVNVTYVDLIIRHRKKSPLGVVCARFWPLKLPNTECQSMHLYKNHLILHSNWNRDRIKRVWCLDNWSERFDFPGTVIHTGYLPYSSPTIRRPIHLSSLNCYILLKDRVLEYIYTKGQKTVIKEFKKINELFKNIAWCKGIKSGK